MRPHRVEQQIDPDTTNVLTMMLERQRRRFAGARGEVPEVIPFGPSVLVGGPAYRGQVSVGHASTLMALVRAAATDRAEAGSHYVTSSTLTGNRIKFLAYALESSADVAISVDSDCSIGEHNGAPGGEILLGLAQRCADLDGPVGVLFAVGDTGNLNAVSLTNTPMRPRERPQPYRLTPCARVATAIIIYPLAWYRRVYAASVAPAWSYVFVPIEESRPLQEQWANLLSNPQASAQLGEDYSHCDSVRAAGGTVRCVYLPSARHDAYAPASARIAD